MCKIEDESRKNRKGTYLGKPGRNGRGYYSRIRKKTDNDLPTDQVPDNSRVIKEPDTAGPIKT